MPSRAANSVHVMKMCAAFAARGASVRLVTVDRPGEPGVADPYGFYGVEPSFELVRARWPAVKGRGYLYGFTAARAGRAFNPELAFCRHLPACWMAVTRWRLPVVFEAHHPVRGTHAFYHSMLRYLARSALLRRLVVISRALAEHYAREYPALGDRILVAPDAADLPGPGASPAPLPAGRLRVGYVGHLYAGRGVELILELAGRCPWADFHLVGGSDGDVASWRSAAAGLGNVTFHGFRAPAETDSYRLAMDVLVAPYGESVKVRGDHLDTARWMSPLKVFEYMAAGRAIIASDLPALREVLTPENAVLAPVGDAGAWAVVLEGLRDPARRAGLGRRARADFEARYSWRARADVLLEAVR